MKKLLLTLSVFASLFSSAQVNWQNSAGAPTNGFWDMDTLNGKLYVSFGGVYEFDGNNWTWLNNYNNSLNTPNKTKSCVKTINGKLYCGAKDFNTSGEGDMHYYDGINWTLLQNTDFPYNGNNKIRAFANYGGEIYASGIFSVPTASSYSNIAKWNGTEWVDVGRNFTNFGSASEIRDMEVYQGKLFITDKNNVWFYNGSSWDSLFSASAFPMGSGISGLVVYNNELYMSGNFNLSSTSTGILLVKYNGSTLSAIAKNGGMSSILATGVYAAIGRMNVVNGKLMFIAKKSADNATYLVSFDGNSTTEVAQLAVSGDWSFGPGSEYTTYTKIAYYGGNVWIGGNYQKIGGQALTGVTFAPASQLVGMNENQNVKLTASVYPNPSSSAIRFSFDAAAHPDLHIFDITGEQVFDRKAISSNTEIQSTLESGIYFYQLRSGDTVLHTGKLIIY